mgnify:FL=1
MSKQSNNVNITLILKIVIAVATAILGAFGAATGTGGSND